MNIKKLIKSIIIILLSIFIIGCNNNKNNIQETFDIEKATNVGKEYMKEYAINADNNIVAYSIDNISESSDSVVLKYKAIKQDNNKLMVSIDNIDIKVIRNKSKYSISEVRASELDAIYTDNNNLRYRNVDVGISELLLRPKDLPRSVYPQDSSIAINKIHVSNHKYNELTVNVDGNKVVLITDNDEGKLITFMQINNDESADGEVTEANGENDNIEVEEIKEKPIATNVIAYDILPVERIDKVVMTIEGDYLLTEYNNSINIYRIPKGEKVDIGLQKLFPGERYNLNIYLINDEGVFIKVKDNNTGIIEVYRIDIKSNNIVKAN